MLMSILLVQCISRLPKDQIWTKVLGNVSILLRIEAQRSICDLAAGHNHQSSRPMVVGLVLLSMDLIYLGLSRSALGDSHFLTLCSSHITFRSLTGLVLSPTHGFFCWKICAATKSMVIPALVTKLSLDHAHSNYSSCNAMRKRVPSTQSHCSQSLSNDR
ncbi:hypothetical protein BDR07DRAFT_757289 [Suillus spraguei]|nr:hypothetical protein BDR07DRAFT_757289 [Suillus spraguei]